MPNFIKDLVAELVKVLIEKIAPLFYTSITKAFAYIAYNIFVKLPQEILEKWEMIVTGFEDFNLLDHVFINDGLKDNSGFKMSPLLVFFTAIAVIVMVVILISNFISAQLSSDPLTMRQKIKESLKSSVKSGGLVIALPVLFFIFKFFITIFQNILKYGLNHLNDVKETKNLVTVIHDTGWLNNNTGEPKIDDLLSKYNWILPIIGFIALAISLTKISMILATRIFKLLFLYMIAPFAAVKMVSDGGRAFHFWKEEIINNFIISLMMVLAITITKTAIFLLITHLDAIAIFKDSLIIVKSLFKLIIIFAGLQFISISKSYMESIIENSKHTNTLRTPKKNWQTFSKLKNNFFSGKDNVITSSMNKVGKLTPLHNGSVLNKLKLAANLSNPNPLNYAKTAVNVGAKVIKTINAAQQPKNERK